MAKTRKRPDYAKWPRRRVKITELYLDPENIRLGLEASSPSQEALINDLFLNEDAMQILESIATNGFFPDEPPVVVKENSRYNVMDGNRRVAALKVLLRPQIVPAKETAVRQLHKQFGVAPREIDVVIAPSKTEVRHLLASKHTQNTRRAWRPLRQAYFYKAELQRGKTVDDLRQEYPNVDIVRFLRLINVHKIAKSISYDTGAISKKVHNERTFPASTIERLYEDKQVRQFLGFEFDRNGELKIHIARKEFVKGIRRIVQDLVEKVVDSRALNKEDDRRRYLAGLSASDTPKKTKVPKLSTSKDFKEVSPQPGSRRTKLAPSNMTYSLTSAGVRRMLVELQKIDYHRFPNAAHDLLRSFLECALKVYFDEQGKKLKPGKGTFVTLDDVLKEFKQEMDTASNKELSQVTQAIISDNTMKAYSAQFLNATNHNPSIFAVAKDVEDAWDKMEKLLRFVLNPKTRQNAQNTP